MKLNSGLRFGVLIAIILFGALALRAFASNRSKQSITVTIAQRTPVKSGESAGSFYSKLIKTDPQCSVDELTYSDKNGVFRLRDLAEKQAKASPLPRETHTGSPHVQQTAVFTSVKGLQALANELDTSAKRQDKTTPTKPTSSPAPQVQQHVETTTPQAAKAISVALSR